MSVRRRARRARLGAALAVVLAASAAGCGGGAGPVSSGPPGIDSPDATFDASGGPEQLAFDAAGNLYVSDCSAARVYVVGPSATLRRVVGSDLEGDAGYEGDGKQALRALVRCPIGIAVDDAGTLFVVDHGNNRVRKIRSDGVISTFAGTGAVGVDAGGYAGDGGPATAARLQEPVGVGLGAGGDVYVADRDNNAIRKIDADGTITTVIGGRGAGFSGDGGPASEARIDRPQQIVVDPDGNVYFADSGNNRVRRIDTEGVVTTVAGNGRAATSGDGGPALSAAVWNPTGLALDDEGNLYVSQPDDNRIRRVDTTGAIVTVAGGSGLAGVLGRRRAGHAGELRQPPGTRLRRRRKPLRRRHRQPPDPGDRPGRHDPHLRQRLTSETGARTARARAGARPRR